ncbi:MAG: hypothetical protein D4S01_05740, partial [Dehalococcoidia bacterium]
MKTAELRKMAEEKEIEGWEEMNKKDLLVALQGGDQDDTPSTSPKATQDDSEVPEPEAPKVEGDGIKESHVPVGSKAELMRDKLSKQPKVRILIPLGDEKIGATFSVIINAYRLNIKKGVYVDVPQQVADIVMESQKQTVSATNNELNLDNPNHPKRKSG